MRNSEVVTAAHPVATPTRNPDAERGVGRAYRHEANMLSPRPVKLQLYKAGMSPVRLAGIGAAYEVKRELIGRTRSLPVTARSGNTDPAAIGMPGVQNKGLVGLGAEKEPFETTTGDIALLGIAAGVVALLYFTSKKG